MHLLDLLEIDQRGTCLNRRMRRSRQCGRHSLLSLPGGSTRFASRRAGDIDRPCPTSRVRSGPSERLRIGLRSSPHHRRDRCPGEREARNVWNGLGTQRWRPTANRNTAEEAHFGLNTRRRLTTATNGEPLRSTVTPERPHSRGVGGRSSVLGELLTGSS